MPKSLREVLDEGNTYCACGARLSSETVTTEMTKPERPGGFFAFRLDMFCPQCREIRGRLNVSDASV